MEQDKQLDGLALQLREKQAEIVALQDENEALMVVNKQHGGTLVQMVNICYSMMIERNNLRDHLRKNANP